MAANGHFFPFTTTVILTKVRIHWLYHRAGSRPLREWIPDQVRDDGGGARISQHRQTEKGRHLAAPPHYPPAQRSAVQPRMKRSLPIT
ncbi:hypothetical protein D0Z70_15080 [Sphingobium terrigena]|uniref:Uncharacterized protein n=1 Tax=Sphingobium terrigena TaxID=2304063 RepID=A0A418YQR4_9SPHN|nr:hypothetical protein D0Z70_15080 [Sphingobium terrigena]